MAALIGGLRMSEVPLYDEEEKVKVIKCAIALKLTREFKQRTNE